MSIATITIYNQDGLQCILFSFIKVLYCFNITLFYENGILFSTFVFHPMRMYQLTCVRIDVHFIVFHLPAPTRIPTKTPSRPPSSTPTSTITLPPTDRCDDDPSFRYRNAKQYKWVAKVRKDPTASEKRCNIKWEGKLIKEYCPVACNACDEACSRSRHWCWWYWRNNAASDIAVGEDNDNDNDKCIDDDSVRYRNIKE